MKRVRLLEFLAWAHETGLGVCCWPGCYEPATHLHHFGPGGMALRGSDLFCAALCQEHHTGKNPAPRLLALMRDERYEVALGFTVNALERLRRYVEG